MFYNVFLSNLLFILRYAMVFGSEVLNKKFSKTQSEMCLHMVVRKPLWKFIKIFFYYNLSFFIRYKRF